jgi:hypothetical protein
MQSGRGKMLIIFPEKGLRGVERIGEGRKGEEDEKSEKRQYLLNSIPTLRPSLISPLRARVTKSSKTMCGSS